MKKIILLAALIFLGITFGKAYNFTTYPAKNIWKSSTQVENYEAIVFQGENISPRDNVLNISEVVPFLEKLWEFWFLKYWYHWENTFSEINDDYLDLSNLDNKKLSYPIIWFSYWKNALFFVHQKNLTSYQRNEIEEEYAGSWFRIIQYTNDLYIISKATDDLPEYRFLTSEYLPLLKNYKNPNLLNFQLWENPLNPYDLNDFQPSFLQLEIVRNSELRWFILGLKPIPSTPTTWGKRFWQEFHRDEETLHDLLWLYESVADFRRTFGWLPEDLNSLHPRYLDITAFNRYHRETMYEKEEPFCFRVGFKPQSQDFKRLFSFEINEDWFWETKFCF